MVFELAINLDNAAFEDPSELPRILKALAERLEGWDPDDRIYHVWDVNGNGVGHFKIEEEAAK